MHIRFNFRLYIHTCHTNFDWCLLNVVFSITKALNGQCSPKKNFYSPNFQCYLENTASLNACFPPFHTSFFHFKLFKYKISLDPHSSLDSLGKFIGGWADLHGLLMIRLCQGRGRFTNAFFSNLKTVNLNIFGSHFLSSLTGKTLTSLQNYGSICTWRC